MMGFFRDVLRKLASIKPAARTPAGVITLTPTDDVERAALERAQRRFELGKSAEPPTREQDRRRRVLEGLSQIARVILPLGAWAPQTFKDRPRGAPVCLSRSVTFKDGTVLWWWSDGSLRHWNGQGLRPMRRRCLR
jgi:hypothetical protein